MHQPTVMVIDNDEAVRTFFEELLATEGYAPYTSSLHNTSVATFEHLQPDMVIIEALHETFDASIDFIQRIHHQTCAHTIPVVVSSTNPKLATRFTRSCQHADCMTLEKPFDINEFLHCVAGVIPAKAQ